MSRNRRQVCERERWARRPSPGSVEVKGADEMTSRMTKRTSTGRESNDVVRGILYYRA
jgi:hypothetical protein